MSILFGPARRRPSDPPLPSDLALLLYELAQIRMSIIHASDADAALVRRLGLEATALAGQVVERVARARY